MNERKGVEKTEWDRREDLERWVRQRGTEERRRRQENGKSPRRKLGSRQEKPGKGTQAVLTAGRRAVGAIQFCPGEAVPGTGCEQR